METEYKIQKASADDDLKDEKSWEDLVFAKNSELALFYFISLINDDYVDSNNTFFRLVKNGTVICSK